MIEVSTHRLVVTWLLFAPGVARGFIKAKVLGCAATSTICPQPSGRELARVLSILCDEFDRTLAGRNSAHAKTARLLKVMLFGSYARGDWVVDPDGGYMSDFDILVVVNHEELADVPDFWRGVKDRLLRKLEGQGAVRTPVNLIVHTRADVNVRLKRGRTFFVDIVRDGILLHDTPDYPFGSLAPLSEEAAREEARGYFDEWFPSAAAFLRSAGYYRSIDRPKEAAFQLHQATERLYHCTLLVLTLYSPKSHKLNFLRSQAERLAPALIEA